MQKETSTTNTEIENTTTNPEDSLRRRERCEIYKINEQDFCTHARFSVIDRKDKSITVIIQDMRPNTTIHFDFFYHISDVQKAQRTRENLLQPERFCRYRQATGIIFFHLMATDDESVGMRAWLARDHFYPHYDKTKLSQWCSGKDRFDLSIDYASQRFISKIDSLYIFHEEGNPFYSVSCHQPTNIEKFCSLKDMNIIDSNDNDEVYKFISLWKDDNEGLPVNDAYFDRNNFKTFIDGTDPKDALVINFHTIRGVSFISRMTDSDFFYETKMMEQVYCPLITVLGGISYIFKKGNWKITEQRDPNGFPFWIIFFEIHTKDFTYVIQCDSLNKFYREFLNTAKSYIQKEYYLSRAFEIALLTGGIQSSYHNGPLTPDGYATISDSEVAAKKLFSKMEKQEHDALKDNEKISMNKTDSAPQEKVEIIETINRKPTHWGRRS